MIPKIIHYCWFGGNPMPEEYANYIAEWGALHKGWKIMKWDESNAPLDLPYIKNAIENNNWANASNLVRLYALQKKGGIYLDTDVKLIKPLDDLLTQDCFLGFEEGSENNPVFWVNNAVMGSVPKHPFITACFNKAVNDFDGTERANESSPKLATAILTTEYGLNSYGKQLLRDNIQLYPKEYFYPISWDHVKDTLHYKDFVTAETYAVHMWGRTWFTREMMLGMIDELQSWTNDQKLVIEQLSNDLNQSTQKLSEKEAIEEKFFVQTSEMTSVVSSYQTYMEEFRNAVENSGISGSRLSEIVKDFDQLFSRFEEIQEKVNSFNHSLVATCEQLNLHSNSQNEILSEFKNLFVSANSKLNENTESLRARLENIESGINRRQDEMLLVINRQEDIVNGIKKEITEQSEASHKNLLGSVSELTTRLDNLDQKQTATFSEVVSSIFEINNQVAAQSLASDKRLSEIMLTLSAISETLSSSVKSAGEHTLAIGKNNVELEQLKQLVAEVVIAYKDNAGQQARANEILTARIDELSRALTGITSASETSNANVNERLDNQDSALQMIWEKINTEFAKKDELIQELNDQLAETRKALIEKDKAILWYSQTYENRNLPGVVKQKLKDWIVKGKERKNKTEK